MSKYNKLVMAMGLAVALPMAIQADCGKETCATSAKAACAASGTTAVSATTACAASATTAVSATTACAATATTAAAACSGACAEGAACCQDEAAKKASLTKVEYKITGMTCGGCSGKVNTALTQVKGVEIETVCHESNKAVVKYNRKQVKDKDVIAAINNTGFTVEAEIIEVKVDGMTCAGCSTKVSSALTKVDGVKEQKVCHVSKHAVVEFDPKKVSSDKVIAAINQTGFKVVQ